MAQCHDVPQRRRTEQAAILTTELGRALVANLVIKMPANLREAGVKEEDLEAIAGKAVEDGNLGILASLGKDEVLQILRAAYNC